MRPLPSRPMPAAPHYPHAPIEEAILMVGVTPAGGAGAETLAPLKDELAGDYPTAEAAGENLFEFEGGPRPSAAARARPTGFLLRDRLDRRLAGLRYDRFSFHRLRPYDRWGAVRDEARRLWDRYRAVARPAAVTDVGLRYVNRFDLPRGGRLSEFLTVYPAVPDWARAAADGAGAGGEAFLQVRLPRPDVEGVLAVTVSTAPPLHGGDASVILDLDLHRDRDVPQGETELWGLFERFRDAKNDAFESFVTDRARDLFR